MVRPDQSVRKELKILAGSITTQVYAKIGMIQVTVFLVTVAFICMTEVTIKQVGSCRRISKKLSEKDGNA
jgi:hypothetical protein